FSMIPVSICAAAIAPASKLEKRIRIDLHQTTRSTGIHACATGVESNCGMELFAVIRTRGDAWQPDVALENQPAWDAHAAFMEVLANEGFVVLGGPLEGTPDVLLIIRAASADAIFSRLDADPWTSMGLLTIIRITPWTIRLGDMLRSSVRDASGPRKG